MDGANKHKRNVCFRCTRSWHYLPLGLLQIVLIIALVCMLPTRGLILHLAVAAKFNIKGRQAMAIVLSRIIATPDVIL